MSRFVSRPRLHWVPMAFRILRRLWVWDRNLFQLKWSKINSILGQAVSPDSITMVAPQSWLPHSLDKFQIRIKEGCRMSQVKMEMSRFQTTTANNQSKDIWIRVGKLQMRHRCYSSSIWTTSMTKSMFKITIIITPEKPACWLSAGKETRRSRAVRNPGEFQKLASIRTSITFSRWAILEKWNQKQKLTKWDKAKTFQLTPDSDRCTTKLGRKSHSCSNPSTC